MELDLPLIWAGVIAFAVCMYVLMDGFDLGIGILFQTVPTDDERDIMMNSVAPVWDGNETWLVLGGGGLLGVYPLAYATLLPALYLPIIVMLVALVFRGVAFEFRFKAIRGKFVWNWAFCLGSLVAAFSQGVVLGAFVQGFEVVDRSYAGGPFDWLTPFSILVGFGVTAGYALLGSTWIIMKTDGPLQRWAYRVSMPLLIAVLGFMVAVSLWVPLLDADIGRRWFSWPNILYLSPVPILVVLATLWLVRALLTDRERLPFLLTLFLFLLGYAGLAISLFPNIVPPDITIWDAASPPETQLFMLVGVAIMMPFVLGYTAYAYWVFRGKVDPHAGYH
ncbi:cytochrome d ubiquinol oxidase subunit II [Constrictibacter sp. MBR-5]|jgi:cytochrome d ubiquinol oxidase subunit II|uniref:cytochrome d ubiquinol oxidase subunit II n=1 Tax=Constrictibacter sp. MBR-5 TaxID=3156467 RepID=UPI003394CFB8